MTTATKEKKTVKKKELPIMDEDIFLMEDTEVQEGGVVHTVRLDRDSYVWVFTGVRGNGKTTAMTYYVVRSVALYPDMKIISNYPIEFMMRRHKPDGTIYQQHIKSEDLDFEKLIMNDENYHHCIICIDEAPDILSHMASLTWKNRLMNAFTRQIRKNFDTLFMGAQSFDWIDKSMRWQVDIEVACVDSVRALGEGSGQERGETLWLRFYDNTGQWTGKTTEDRYRSGENPIVDRKELFPRVMWGDEDHEPVYNTYHQIDILESLRKVDLRLSKIKIGDGFAGETSQEDRHKVSTKTLYTALGIIDNVLRESPESPLMYQPDFFDSLGGITEQDRANIGKVLSDFQIERGKDNSNGKRWYGFGSFDTVGFTEYVHKHKAGTV